MNCPSDPLSQTTAASKHNQCAGSAKPCALAAQQTSALEPATKKTSLTMNHRDMSPWEQFCIPMEEGGFAPYNCHKTVRHSMTTESCCLEAVRHDSVHGAEVIYLSQAWHPHAQVCGYFANTLLPRKVNDFLYVELWGSGSLCHIFLQMVPA